MCIRDSPSSIIISILEEEASILFSTNSLTTFAGLSMTSPAAILFEMCIRDSPSVAGHPLRSATHRRLGRPLPYQPANAPQAHPSVVPKHL